MRALAVAVLVFVALAAWDLETPGLGYDEAFDAAIAVQWMHGQPLETAGIIRVNNQRLPIMSTDIEGPLGVYLSAVAFKIFGTTVQTLRVLHIAMGGVTLVLLWVVTRTWVDQTAAAFTVLLCATCPPFVWWTRAGGHWNALLLPCSLGMFLAGRYAWCYRKARWFGVTGLCAGLGVTTKILFVWWVFPIAVTAWWVNRTQDGDSRWRWVSWRHGVAAVVGLIVGVWPLLLYNWPDLPTLRFILRNLVTTELYGYTNLDLGPHVASQWMGWMRTMGGDTFDYSGRPGLPVGSVLMVWSAVVTVWALWRCRRDMQPDALDTARVFLVVAVFIMVPVSAVTTSHNGPGYLLLLVPAAWMLVGMALRDAAQATGGHWSVRWLRTLIVVVGVATIGYQAVMNVRVIHALQRTGGRGMWSDAVARLAVVLENEFPGRQVVAMDWGIARNLVVLTDGRLRPSEPYDRRSAPLAGAELACATLLADPSNVYVYHAAPHVAFPGTWRRCLDAASDTHVLIRLERVVRTRAGEAILEIYTAGPPSTVVSATRP